MQLNKPLAEEDLQHIKKGLKVDDEQVIIPNIRWSKEDDKTLVGIELVSHKNRLVKRIFQHLGYKVIKVDRVLYCGLTKKNLKRGHWRLLQEKEVRNIKFF